MTRAVISLGSNLGDRLGYLRLAHDRLRDLGIVISVSSLYETRPVGGPPQDDFLNAAVLLDTDLDASDLLVELKRIEDEAGRVVTERWGPRTLDLDLITLGVTTSSGSVELPHPRAHLRRFVLEPVAEIAPRVKLGDGSTPESALARIKDQEAFRFRGDWRITLPAIGPIGGFLVAIQLFLMSLIFMLAVLDTHSPIGWVRGISGGVLALAGSALVLGAGMALGSDLSSLPDSRPGSALRDRGVYGLVRHPIYGGALIGGVAISLVSGSWRPLPVTAVLALLFDRKTYLEERSLGVAHAEYRSYRKRVRRRFIPFLW